MNEIDRVAEWRQVTEHYRALSDDELVAIARQKDDLTDVAQQALAAEILHRKLEIPREEPEEELEVLPDPELDPDSPYAEDRELVVIETVYSLRDALQLQSLLAEDGIPFYIGQENATSVDAVKSKFANGVEVKIMRIGLAFATRARIHFHPQDDPGRDEREGEIQAVSVSCPKCKSEDVTLEEAERGAANPEVATKYEWSCNACGYHWEDAGVIGEK